MFESALHQALAADGDLAELLSTYEGAPAIFSDEAPAKAVEPYLIYRITRLSTENDAVQSFNIYLDYFDTGKSWARSRAAAFRIECMLDKVILTSERFDKIRLFYESDGSVPDTEIHHNLQFSARATRKAWAQQL